MRPSRSTYGVVIVALVAMVGSAVWIASGPEREVPSSGEPTRQSDLEALLGMQAARTGKVDRPRSVGSTASHEPHRRVRRESEPEAVVPARAGVPARAHPVVRIREGGRVAIRSRPGGEAVAVVGSKTEFGSPTVFGVVRAAGLWVGVSTPAVPNDRLGWIRLDRRIIETSWTERSIHVSLPERRATLRERGQDLHTFRVTIGAPGSKTPTGRFAVTDIFRGGLNPVYGCCAVALSAIQPDLPPGWPGGDRIAFHGNGTGAPLGEATSNGCLRAADGDVDALVDQVDLGTPVFIHQ